MTRRGNLRRLLESHDPTDAVERGHLTDMMSLLNADGDPFSRDHFEPGHFTASAFVVSSEGLLMVFHRRLQRWLQPGGHIDPGDVDSCAAASREVEEETGIRPDGAACPLLDVDVHQILASPKEPAHLHFDVRFRFTASGEPTARDDVADARWVAIGEVADIGTDESVRRAVAKLR